MNSPLKYHGGKHFLASKIVAMMPKHTRYLEAYAGGLSVLFAKDGEGISEFANDTNGDLMNFWSILGNVDAYYRFSRVVQCIPLSEDAFHTPDLNEYFKDKCGVDYAVARAITYFVRMRQSRQGIGKSYCTPTSRTRRGMNENVSAWLTSVDGLPEVHERLRRVEVWNRPAVEAIQKLDGEDTLVYCDPPYMHETRSTKSEYGDNEMSDADHAELLDCLSSIKGKFILSGYRSSMYDEASKKHGWLLAEFDVANSASGAKRKERKTECVWMNFLPEAV